MGQDRFGAENFQIIEEGRPSFSKKKVRKERLKAALITVIAGPVGAHRIFLGTEGKTPIIYAITLGGFGLLPIIDLGYILFSKDLKKLKANPNVFIWQEGSTQ